MSPASIVAVKPEKSRSLYWREKVSANELPQPSPIVKPLNGITSAAGYFTTSDPPSHGLKSDVTVNGPHDRESQAPLSNGVTPEATHSAIPATPVLTKPLPASASPITHSADESHGGSSPAV
jgi:hypothetical protein